MRIKPLFVKIIALILLCLILGVLLVYAKDDIKKEVAIWKSGNRKEINNNYKTIKNFCMVDNDCVIAKDPSGCCNDKVYNKNNYKEIKRTSVNDCFGIACSILLTHCVNSRCTLEDWTFCYRNGPNSPPDKGCTFVERPQGN